MKILGVVLVVLSILGFVFGGVKFKQSETVADVGPLEIQKEETKHVPVTPLASGALLIAGLVLVVAGMRKR